MQTPKRPWLPSVAGKWRADEDVEEPWDQGTSNGEEEDGVKRSSKPLNDGASSEEEQDDGSLDKRQYWYVQQIECHDNLQTVSIVVAMHRGSTYGVVFVVVWFYLIWRHLPDVHANMPNLDICALSVSRHGTLYSVRTFV